MGSYLRQCQYCKKIIGCWKNGILYQCGTGEPVCGFSCQKRLEDVYRSPVTCPKCEREHAPIISDAGKANSHRQASI